MESGEAFAMGRANRGKPLMVFDWDKAARLIVKKGADEAEAGLTSDWEWTGGLIFRKGLPDKESYTYLASTWATPQLLIDGEYIDCFKMQSETPNWGAETKWPDSALEILKKGKK